MKQKIINKRTNVHSNPNIDFELAIIEEFWEGTEALSPYEVKMFPRFKSYHDFQFWVSDNNRIKKESKDNTLLKIYKGANNGL